MNSRTDCTNNLENLKKLWLFSNYIMDKNLEECFISYLLEVREDDVFDNLTLTASNLIKEYQITEDDIRLQLNQMIPVI